MTDKNLIKILGRIALLLELKGENPFKSRAYTNAAQVIKSGDIDVALEVQAGTLGNIKGFGEALQKKITEYVQTGKISYYENLVEEIPKELIRISRLSTIGPSKARDIYYKYNITSVDELENACLEDKLSRLKGFGAKSQENILNAINHYKASKGKHNQREIFSLAQELLQFIQKISGNGLAEITGNYRRISEVITDLHIIASPENKEIFVNEINNAWHPELNNGVYQFRAGPDILISITLTDKQNYFSQLHSTTGCGKYISEFDEWLVKNGKTDKLESSVIKSEEDLYKIAGIQFVPPELRESASAVQEAVNHKIPVLIEERDLKGMLHVHSNWSDGLNTIKDMALKSKELGFEYILICDHSQSAGYANGLTPDRILRQHEEIDKLNSNNLGIKILKGIESDILPDGSLDYSENILQLFDVVVASVHSSFRMNKEHMTKRISYALRSPYTSILGHPTGRLLLARPAYEVDIYELINVAAEENKVIEINSNPYRLDLPWNYLKYAKECGVKIAINPDSHSVDALQDVFYGLKFARKGWLTRDDIINCLNYEEFTSYFTYKR